MLEQGGAGCSPASPAVEQGAHIFLGLVSISVGEEGVGRCSAAELGGDGCKDGWGRELLLSTVCTRSPEVVLQPLGILRGRLSPVVGAAAHRCGVSPGLEEGRGEKGKAMLQAEVRHSSLRRRRNRMRAAVRKRMDVRMKMRTQAVKRAWWTQTRMQRRRVKCGATCAAQGMGVHLLVSPGTELWSWEGRVCWHTLATSPLRGLEKHQGCRRESPALFGVLLLPSDVGSHQLPLLVLWLSGAVGAMLPDPSQPDCPPPASSREFPGRPGGPDL